MLTYDVTNTAIDENEESFVFLLEKNKDIPFSDIKNLEDGFLLLGLPFLCEMKSHGFVPCDEENNKNYQFVHKILNKDGIDDTKNETCTSCDLNRYQIEFLKRQVDTPNVFKDWNEVQYLISKNQLKVKTFSKALQLNEVSIGCIKLSVFNSILKNYKSSALGSYEEFSIEFPKLFETKNKVQKVLNRNESRRKFYLRFFSINSLIEYQDLNVIMPFVFVLNSLAENGFLIKPSVYNEKSKPSFDLLDEIIHIENQENQSIKCLIDNYIVFQWDNIEEMLKQSCEHFYIDEYKSLLLRHIDNCGRIYFNNDLQSPFNSSQSYPDELILAIKNIKHNLNLDLREFIIQL